MLLADIKEVKDGRCITYDADKRPSKGEISGISDIELIKMAKKYGVHVGLYHNAIPDEERNRLVKEITKDSALGDIVSEFLTKLVEPAEKADTGGLALDGLETIQQEIRDNLIELEGLEADVKRGDPAAKERYKQVAAKIRQLRESCRANAKDAMDMLEGDRVRITYGKYSGKVGSFIEYSPSGEFAIVQVAGVKISLDVSDLKKV
jgi:hypothetical protein